MSTQEENVAVVRAYIAAGNARDYAELDRLRLPDFRAHVPIGGALDEADPIGAEALNRDHVMIVGVFPDLRADERDLVAAGDRVVVRVQLSGTHTGNLGEVAPTGRRIAWDTVHVYRLDGGRIAEAWFVTDTLGLLRQAGAVELLVGRPDAA